MGSEIGITETVVIRQQLGRLTPKEISELIEKPVSSVLDAIDRMGKAMSDISEKMKKAGLKEKMILEREEKKRKALKWEEKKRIKQLVRDQKVAQIENRKTEKVFKSREWDRSKMKTVRVDHKTFIEVPFMDDPDLARERFLKARDSQKIIHGGRYHGKRKLK